MSETQVGRCGNCGGPVMLHTGPWMGIYPPVPRCTRCGATPRTPADEVLPMNPSPPPIGTDPAPPRHYEGGTPMTMNLGPGSYEENQ